MNEIIKLNLNDIKNAVLECVSKIHINSTLFENANERKRQEIAHNETLNVVRNFFKNGEWLDTVFEHQDNPERMTYLDYMVYHFEEEFFHAPRPSKPIIRIEPMAAQLAFGFGFQQQNPDQTKLNELAAILTYIESQAKLNKIEIPKVAQMSPVEMFNTFINIVRQEMEKRRADVENSEYENINQDYEILFDIDFKTANKIGNLSNPSGKLCYTQSEKTWNQYTKDGFNTVYVLLKKDYDKIPAEHNGVNEYDFLPEDGYDEYGLSMIFIFVDGEGNLAYCNTRWNHGANYGPGKSVDHALNESDISKIIGANFYGMFKGNDKFKNALEQSLKRIANGEDPKNIFNSMRKSKGFTIVELHGKYNILTKDCNFLSDKWLDKCGDFHSGLIDICINGKYNYMTSEGKLLTKQWFEKCFCFDDKEGVGGVVLNNKVNFITKEGETLSDIWFDVACGFEEGLSAVRLNDKWNFITRDGKLFLNQWFDGCSNFEDGLALVSVNRKYNFITKEKTFLSKQWFDNCEFFEGDLAIVKLNDKYNFITREGKIFSHKWFEYCEDFDEGYSMVRLNGKFNFVSTKGEFISNIWFDSCEDFYDGLSAVELHGKYNFLKANGEFLSEQWFDECDNLFYDDLTIVRLNDKYNFLKINGGLLSKQWFDYCYDFRYGLAQVELDDKVNFITKQGNLISDIWFDDCNDFNTENVCLVKLNGKYNFIYTDGYLLSNTWFDYCEEFYDGMAMVKLNNKYNFINYNGNLISDKWFDGYDGYDNKGAIVKLNGSWKHITKYGEILSLPK